MRNLVCEIKESEILLDDYYDMEVVEEVVIFNDWLIDNGVLGQWARGQILNKNWKRTMERDEHRQWIKLSK